MLGWPQRGVQSHPVSQSESSFRLPIQAACSVPQEVPSLPSFKVVSLWLMFTVVLMGLKRLPCLSFNQKEKLPRWSDMLRRTKNKNWDYPPINSHIFPQLKLFFLSERWTHLYVAHHFVHFPIVCKYQKSVIANELLGSNWCLDEIVLFLFGVCDLTAKGLSCSLSSSPALDTSRWVCITCRMKLSYP